MKKLISLFSAVAITLPATLLIVSCGEKLNPNVEMWIESAPNSPSLKSYIEAADEFNKNPENKIKVEVKNVAKGNLELELLSNKYAPDIINGSIDKAFRLQQIRQEKIMPIEFGESTAFNESFLEYGQDKDDNQLMTPIGKSFSVLLINKKILKSLNLGSDLSKSNDDLVNQIWEKREEVISKLNENNIKMLGIDDMSDLVNLQYAQDSKITTSEINKDYFFNYYDETLFINKGATSKIDSLMSNLNQIKGSLIISDQNTRPSSAFFNEKLLMSTASSAGLNYYNEWDENWQDDIAIINLPSSSDFMVQRGDGLIALESGNDEKEKTTNDFINYLVDSKTIWNPAGTSGYIPWTNEMIGEGGEFKFEPDTPQQAVLDMVQTNEKQFSIEANESSELYNQFIFNEMLTGILKSEDGWKVEKLTDSNAMNAYENASKSRKIKINEN